VKRAALSTGCKRPVKGRLANVIKTCFIKTCFIKTCFDDFAMALASDGKDHPEYAGSRLAV
jgi:hypothetical protein